MACFTEEITVRQIPDKVSFLKSSLSITAIPGIIITNSTGQNE